MSAFFSNRLSRPYDVAFDERSENKTYLTNVTGASLEQAIFLRSMLSVL